MSNDSDRDLYLVLRVAPSAARETVRAAYRALARKHHPDAGGDAARMTELNRAWEVLGDTKRRASYDAERTETGYLRPIAKFTPGPVVGTVLDFGRYAGWSIGALAQADPDYLEWLGRAPIGRSLRREIDGRLGARATAAEALVPLRSGRGPAWRMGTILGRAR